MADRRCWPRDPFDRPLCVFGRVHVDCGVRKVSVCGTIDDSNPQRRARASCTQLECKQATQSATCPLIRRQCPNHKPQCQGSQGVCAAFRRWKHEESECRRHRRHARCFSRLTDFDRLILRINLLLPPSLLGICQANRGALLAFSFGRQGCKTQQQSRQEIDQSIYRSIDRMNDASAGGEGESDQPKQRPACCAGTGSGGGVQTLTCASVWIARFNFGASSLF